MQDAILCNQGITWHNDQRQASRWAYWQQVLKCNFMCHMSLCRAMPLEHGIPETSAPINSALRCAMPGSLGILQATTETSPLKWSTPNRTSLKIGCESSEMDPPYPWRSPKNVRGWWYSPCIRAKVAPRMPYHQIQGTSENEVPLTDTRNRPQGGPTSRHKEATSRKLQALLADTRKQPQGSSTTQ